MPLPVTSEEELAACYNEIEAALAAVEQSERSVVTSVYEQCFQGQPKMTCSLVCSVSDSTLPRPFRIGRSEILGVRIGVRRRGSETATFRDCHRPGVAVRWY